MIPLASLAALLEHFFTGRLLPSDGLEKHGLSVHSRSLRLTTFHFFRYAAFAAVQSLRISEMTGITRTDVIFGAGTHVRVISKGRTELLHTCGSIYTRCSERLAARASMGYWGHSVPQRRGHTTSRGTIDTTTRGLGRRINFLMVLAKDQPTTLSQTGTDRLQELTLARIALLSNVETPTVSLVIARLQYVRQLYALLFLLRVPDRDDTHYVRDATVLLESGLDTTIVQVLPFQLQVRAAGLGSFWVELFITLQDPSKVVAAVKAAAAAALFAAQWISSWKDKTATTDIKQVEVKIKECEARAAGAKADSDEATAKLAIAKARVEEQLVRSMFYWMPRRELTTCKSRSTRRIFSELRS